MDELICLMMISQDPEAVERVRKQLPGDEFDLRAYGSLKTFGEAWQEMKAPVVLFDRSVFWGDQEALFLPKTDESPEFIFLETSDDASPSIPVPVFTVVRPDAENGFLVFVIRQAMEMRKLRLRIRELEDRLTGVRLKDVETGLFNEGYLRDRLSSEFKRANRYVYPLSVILISIEGVHRKGEQLRPILSEISRFLLYFSRGNDIVGYLNEGQFAIFLPDTAKKGGGVFAKRLLEVLLERFGGQKAKRHIKVSIGLANYPSDGVRDESALLDLAKRALKNAGKGKHGGLYTFKGISREDILSIVTKKGKLS